MRFCKLNTNSTHAYKPQQPPPRPVVMSSQAAHDKLLSEIQRFDDKKLHHVQEAKDKSMPLIDPEVELKKVDRTAFLKEVRKGVDLEPVPCVKDRSAPIIDDSCHVKKMDRRYPFLDEVEKKKGSTSV